MIRGILLLAMLAQTPEFDVASVKPAAPLVPGGTLNGGVRLAGSQLTCTFLSLKQYIKLAYRVKDHQIEGPDWIGSQRFDIAAKLPAGASHEQVPAMMQKLLQDRFKLAFHHGSKEFPVYALVLGKAPLKLKESPLDPDTDVDSAGRSGVDVNATGGRGGSQVTLGRGSSFSIGPHTIDVRKMTLAGIADVLGRFVDRPVVDMSGLTATYDFAIEFNRNDLALAVRAAVAEGSAPPDALRGFDNLPQDSAPSIFDSLQSLGLKLEPRKAPLDVMIIDRLEKLPTDN
jgi:uncharacterized protein (TIGR03435 family)